MQLLRVLQVLVVPHEGLLGEIVAALLHREHGAPLPVLGRLLLLLDLRLELLLVGDRGRYFLLGLGQLPPHLDEQLIQYLLRILSPPNEGVDVGLDDGHHTLEHAHIVLTPPGMAPGPPDVIRAHSR